MDCPDTRAEPDDTDAIDPADLPMVPDDLLAVAPGRDLWDRIAESGPRSDALAGGGLVGSVGGETHHKCFRDSKGRVWMATALIAFGTLTVEVVQLEPDK